MPEIAPEKPERIALQQPTVAKPDTPRVDEYLDCCGNCPGWHRKHALAPFGECLVALRFLGQTFYRADRDTSCSFTEEAKQKALQRR